MNPGFVDADAWQQIHTLLTGLWVYMLLQVTFAFFLLLSHSIIPSLVQTGHLPPAAARIRPILYALFGLALIATLVAVFNAFGLMDVIYGIYPRRWV